MTDEEKLKVLDTLKYLFVDFPDSSGRFNLAYGGLVEGEGGHFLVADTSLSLEPNEVELIKKWFDEIGKRY